MRSYKNSTSQYNINDLSELKQGGEKYDFNLRKIKYLRQKCKDLETKFKIEELNYLFCIGEQEKKIIELEKRLNMNNVDNMPREKLKLYKCFPNYVKFDYIHDNNNTNRKSSNNSRKKIIGSKSQNSYQELGIIPKNYSLDEKNNIKLNKT